MSSQNHQFAEFADSVYSRYKKTSAGAVSGIRSNPNEPNKRISWLLESNASKFNIDTKRIEFDYDTDVIELYSAQEDKVFKALNPYLFMMGLMAPHNIAREAIISNALDDEEILKIAALKNTLQFTKRIKSIDSTNTLRRIQDTVINKNRPYSFVKAVAERITELGS